MKKILVLTDFSETATFALKSGLELAKSNNTPLILYHNNTEAKTSLAIDINPTKEIPNSLPTNVIALLNHQIISDRLENIKLTYIESDIPLIEAVSQLIEQNNIELLVMGTQGAGHTSKTWGSTTQKIVDNISIPVLLVREDNFNLELKRVLYASGFMSSEKKVFQKLLDSSLISPNTEIHLAAIDTTNFFTQPTIVMIEAMKSFERMAKEYVTETHFYADYSIEAGIKHLADKIQPDIIVMAEEKHNNLLKTIFGNNETLNVAKQIDYPLLIVG